MRLSDLLVAAPAPPLAEPVGVPITFRGEIFHADPSGVLLWPSMQAAIVADLHLEKSTSRVCGASPLPPYDTAATIGKLSAVLRQHRPRHVLCLGDSFHDREAGARLDPADRDALAALVGAHRWLWISGNHDPAPPPHELGGRVVDEVAIGGLIFRHAARPDGAGEISGHYHPKAALSMRGRRLVGRCFVADETRLILPAFGAYAGGLDVLDPAISRLFPDGFGVHLIGRNRVVGLPHHRLQPIASGAEIYRVLEAAPRPGRRRRTRSVAPAQPAR